jgi:hypothetical protein
MEVATGFQKGVTKELGQGRKRQGAAANRARSNMNKSCSLKALEYTAKMKAQTQADRQQTTTFVTRKPSRNNQITLPTCAVAVDNETMTVAEALGDKP